MPRDVASRQNTPAAGAHVKHDDAREAGRGTTFPVRRPGWTLARRSRGGGAEKEFAEAEAIIAARSDRGAALNDAVAPQALASLTGTPIDSAVPRLGRAQSRRLARSVSLAFADGICLILAVFALSAVFPVLQLHRITFVIIALIWVLLGSLAHELDAGFDVHLAHGFVDEMPRLFWWSVGATIAAEFLGAGVSLPAELVLVACVFLFSGVARTCVTTLWRRFTGPERVVLIGGEEVVAHFRRKLELERTANAVLVACVPPSKGAVPLEPRDLIDVVTEVVHTLSCHRIVVGAGDVTGAQLRSITDVGRLAQLKISILPALDGAIGSRARVRQLAELSMLEFHCRPMSPATARVKRSLDVVISLILLCVTVPVFLVVGVCIRLADGGPVFFRQSRGGQDAAPFTMYKFRTMVIDADARLRDLVDLNALTDPMYKVKGDPRITRVGGLLRRSSLDELPQLINVLRGEMSIVGPRPEDVRLVRQYDADALAVRCGMKPGITGPMQVHGRGELTFAERIALEREYLENYTLLKDLHILALTAISLIVRRSGAY